MSRGFLYQLVRICVILGTSLSSFWWFSVLREFVRACITAALYSPCAAESLSGALPCESPWFLWTVDSICSRCSELCFSSTSVRHSLAPPLKITGKLTLPPFQGSLSFIVQCPLSWKLMFHFFFNCFSQKCNLGCFYSIFPQNGNPHQSSIRYLSIWERDREESPVSWFTLQILRAAGMKQREAGCYKCGPGSLFTENPVTWAVTWYLPPPALAGSWN